MMSAGQINQKKLQERIDLEKQKMFKPSVNTKSQIIVENKGRHGKVEEGLLKKGMEYKEKLRMG